MAKARPNPAGKAPAADAAAVDSARQAAPETAELSAPETAAMPAPAPKKPLHLEAKVRVRLTHHCNLEGAKGVSGEEKIVSGAIAAKLIEIKGAKLLAVL